MDLSSPFYLLAIFSVLVTGLSKSGFGGGLGVMAVPMMSIFVSPQFAAAVMMPMLLAMDILIVWRYRKRWNRQILLNLLPAAIAGLVIGGMVFQHMNASVIRFFIGLLAAFFVVQFFLSTRRKKTSGAMPRPVVWLLGLLSGFSSFIAHAGGPPVKGYLLQQDLEKSWFVGTNTMFFFTLNALKALAYGAAGALSPDSLLVSAWLSPFVLFGVYLGARLHSVINQAIFVKIVYGFLAVTSAKLLSDGVSAFLF